MQVFIINLAQETKRRAFQEKQFQALGLKPTFIKAISADDIDDHLYQKHYYDWQRPLRKVEMACYFSHQALWKKIISNNQPALILEDDAILSKELPNILKDLEKCIDIDLLDLEVFNKNKYVAKIGKSLINDYKLFYIHLNSAGAGAYIVYPSGAKKLLSHENKKGISPADAYISSCHQLKAFQIEPALAMQCVFLESYGLENKYKELAYSATSKGEIPKRAFIFRLKRIYAQIKLGLYKLSLLPVAHKRLIAVKTKDFIK